MVNDLNEFNILLESYGLNNFQHRLFIRMSSLVHGILNNNNSPKLLREQIVFNKQLPKNYSLLNENQIKQSLALKNHYGESTFIYIFSRHFLVEIFSN